MRLWRCVLLACFVLGLVGCSLPLPEDLGVRVGDLPFKRVALSQEWRDARRLPNEEHVVLDLGTIPEGGALRLGLLAMNGAAVRVFAGDSPRGVAHVPAKEAWEDLRFDLAGDTGKPCRVSVEGARGAWLGPCELVSPGRKDAPNVLIFLIDTLRKDHVGAYGYGRDTTPHVDGLAKDGVVFRRLVPQSSWTKPSVASLLTSTYPNVHGAQDRPDVMRQGLPTLAKALEGAGYETHAFFTNINVLPLWGFGNEFTRCVDVDSARWREADDGKVVDAAIRTLEHVRGRPWFMYVHTMGPHDPYTPPAPYARRFVTRDVPGDAEARRRQAVIDAYDGEIAYTDAQLGRLVGALKRFGEYDDTLIIVLSDHGEEFHEHGGEFHGHTLYEELLGVPLVMKLPGGRLAGESRGALVQAVDIAPTILDIVGAEAEPRFQGRSFVDVLENSGLDVRTGYASLVNKALSLRAATTNRGKYIHDLVERREMWFDLERDPGEQHPMGAPDEAGSELARHAARIGSIGAHGLHVLITCGDGAEHEVEGVVRAEGMGEYEFRYYEWKSGTSREGDSLTFWMRTKHPEDETRARDVWHGEHAEQDHAHLRVEIGESAPIEVTMTVDGQPIAPQSTTVGAERRRLGLAGARFQPAEILAGPDAFDPAALPRQFGVYVWYVPRIETLEVEELDDATVEALRGLGYLN